MIFCGDCLRRNEEAALEDSQRRERAMLKPGEKAPDFRLQTDAGEEVSLGGLKGKSALLYFFPKADTPG